MARARRVTVVGGGPAGLEAARIAAIRGHHVILVERTARLGGLAGVAGPNAALAEWQAAEVARLGVDVRLGTTDIPDGDAVVQCTGSVPGAPDHDVSDPAIVLDVADVHRGAARLPEHGDVVLLDPIGGPIAVALAEALGPRAVLVTQDQIAGNELARSGDLAPANVRLAQRGVRIERRSLVVAVRPGGPDGAAVELRDRFSGERRTLSAAAVVDCGFRLPSEPLPGVTARAGDCVAPRTVYEAVLEGRRAARGI